MAHIFADNTFIESTKTAPTCTVLGSGILSLFISDIRQLTPCIRAYKLRDLEGRDLPTISAGARLQVPVLLNDGKTELRHFSICSNPLHRNAYEIAVQEESGGHGLSKSIHDNFYVGLQLNCEPPENHFQLHADNNPTIFIAGGIGIVPIKSMAQILAARGRRLQLHYAGRSLKEMAFSDFLASEFANHFFAYPADENKRLNIMQVLSDAPHNALFYVCGPQKLLDDVYNSAALLKITSDRIQSEQSNTVKNAIDNPVIIELACSNKLIQVTSDQSILTALRKAGVVVNFDCCVGDCGTCAVKILEGNVDHRDNVLSDKDRADGMICICVSRAISEKLILDL